ncbi:thiamine phosphate synthase [Sulfitobacter sp. LCG007]
MSEEDAPQIYLVTPPQVDLEGFPDLLGRLLDGIDIACVRLALSTRDEDSLARAADALREVTHARDVALVLSEHVLLAQRLGLDGVHLPDAARSVRAARKTLGEDAIVGSFCGGSRHDGLSAGEAGADYVSLGPVRASPLGDGSFAEADLFQWWSEVIEIPVVAEGGLDEETIRDLAPFADFFGIGDEIWHEEDPLATLSRLSRAMA